MKRKTVFRLFSFMVLFAWPAWSGDPLRDIEGYWGLEALDDMSCANNPTFVDFLDETGQIALTWPKAVTYSDGSVSDAVTFTVIETDGRLFRLKRDRDGVSATMQLAPDLLSFYYNEPNGNEGSKFDRCALASS